MLVAASSGVAWLFTLFIAALFGGIGGSMAKKRGRREWLWTTICFLTGFIGIIVLAIAGKTDAQKRADVVKYLPGSTEEPQVPTTVPEDWVAELRELSDLHDRGALSDEEFAREKEKVMAHH